MAGWIHCGFDVAAASVTLVFESTLAWRGGLLHWNFGLTGRIAEELTTEESSQRESESLVGQKTSLIQFLEQKLSDNACDGTL